MRNLKKILALVMALAMSLSLVTIANAADFTDNDDISYEEAADVMSAIGVIEGFEDGSFDPDGTLTREQAAKLVTYMLLGTNADRLGVEGSTFKDVAATRWSASAIEYCASLGLIDGAGDGNFYPAGQLTANAFAKILLTALGYSSEKEGMTGPSWSVNVAALAMEVGLDDGIEDLAWSAVLSREEAAQMALNAICAPLVAYENDVTIVVGDTPVSFGSGDAYYITTTLAREQRISDQTLSNTKEYTVEFGERYFPNLRLASDPDEFNRPCHTWVYGNEEIGSYVDYDLLVATYTEGVTGQDLYDLIGRSTIADYDTYYYVDGAESDVIRTSNMIRTNTRTYSTTGNGVLTQVFVDHNANNGDGEITITSINTYLAQANADYNTRQENLSLSVFTDRDSSGNTVEYSEVVTIDDVSGIEDYQEGDFVLVNMAAIGSNGRLEVVRVSDPEVMTDCQITRFSTGSYVVTGGNQYDYAEKNFYKDNVLRVYNQSALTNYTYNVYLDQYGYAIGVEEYAGQDNYLFMTGYDRSTSHLGVRTATAAAIFLDGTMTTISVNVDDTNANIGSTYNYFQLNNGMARYNRWFTYTTSTQNGETVYTLTPADNWLNVNLADSETINSSSVRLTASSGEGNTTIPGSQTQRAYGNDDSIYLTVDTGATDFGTAINKVTGVYTGVQDVDLEVTAGTGFTNSIFAVYDDDRYIIGAVVIGKDVNGTENYAYGIDNEAMNEYIVADDDDNYYWDFEAVVDGHIETLTVKTEYRSVIDRIQTAVRVGSGAMLQLTYDADGYVTDALVCVDSSPATGETDENVYGNNDTGRDINATGYTDKVYLVNVNSAQQLFTTGRTLYIGSLDDFGVTIASGAPVIVIQEEHYNGGGSSVVAEEYSTIAGALSVLGDANTSTSNIKEFVGQISAVLNDNGTAEYLVLNSATPVGVTTDDGSHVRGDLSPLSMVYENGWFNVNVGTDVAITAGTHEVRVVISQNGYTVVDSGRANTISATVGSMFNYGVAYGSRPSGDYTVTVEVYNAGTNTLVASGSAVLTVENL